MPLPPRLNLSQYLKPQPSDTPSSKYPNAPQAHPQAPKADTQTTTDIRTRLRQLAPAQPVELMIDDPVFETEDAARILGVTESRMEKWRQRDQGPEFLFYDRDGVRYELSSLIAFKAARRIRPSRQPHPGKRY